MRGRGLALVVLAACGAKKEPAPQAEPGAVDAAAKIAKAATDAAPAAPADPAERDARAVLDAWKAAQDGGDFAAYEALYHPAFEGVRRSGKQVKQLDRAAWMRDRKKMFAAAMTVEIADLAVKRDGDTLAVTFTQTWTSGTYRDRGTKAMTLARDGEPWRIRREELLDSTILPVTPPDAGVPVAAAPADAGPELGPTPTRGDPSIAKITFGLSDAIDVGHLELALIDGDEVLLAQSDVDFGKGPLEVLDKHNSYGNGGGDSYAYSQREAGDDVPPALQAAAGAAVVVLDEELLPVCQGKLGAPTYLETADTVESDDDATIVASAWSHGPWIVRVELDADCVDGAFVRAASLPALVVRKPDKKIAKKLARAAKKAARAEHKGADAEVTIVAAPDGTHFAAASFEIEDTCDRLALGDAGWHLMLSSTGSWTGTDTLQEDRLLAALDLGADGDLDLVTGRGTIDTGDAKGGWNFWRPDLREPQGEAGCDGAD